MVAAVIRTILTESGTEYVCDQHDVIATMLGVEFPKVEVMLREAAGGINAFLDFPSVHWKKVWSTKPLERVKK